MFFSRRQTEKPPRKASVMANKQPNLIHQPTVIHQPPKNITPPKEQSYYDMMEEVLLQTIRSSSMALLDLYKRRGQAHILPPPFPETKMLPPPEAFIPPQRQTVVPQPIQQRPVPQKPAVTQAPIQQRPPVQQAPKKLHLEQVNINTISKKIISEIDDLIDISSFNEKALKEVLKQSLTWNTVSPKVDTESLSSLFKSLYTYIIENFEEEVVDPTSAILDELVKVFKNFKGEVNSEMFISTLNKTATWNKLATQTKKEILKPLYSSFNSRRADFMRDVYPVAKPSGSMSTGTPTNKNDGSDKGRGVQELGEPSQYSPVHSYGVSNLDKADAYGRTPANNMNNIREVQNAPGSSRVIPQNSGFVNNASEKAKKVSELTQAILSLEKDYEDEYEDSYPENNNFGEEDFDEDALFADEENGDEE
jgi:hypothetical protein